MGMTKLSELPNGSLILYRKKLYFLSKGLDDRIVTDVDGNWRFIHDLNWKTFDIIHINKQGRTDNGLS